MPYNNDIITQNHAGVPFDISKISSQLVVLHKVEKSQIKAFVHIYCLIEEEPW